MGKKNKTIKKTETTTNEFGSNQNILFGAIVLFSMYLLMKYIK